MPMVLLFSSWTNCDMNKLISSYSKHYNITKTKIKFPKNDFKPQNKNKWKKKNRLAHQERIKLRERIPHIGPIPIVIPLKIFLDLFLDPLLPRELFDSQSYVLNFINVDSWAKSQAMLRDVRESNCELQPYGSDGCIRFVNECDFKEVSVVCST